MRIFSFRKPIVINGENIVINDLAFNHKYKKEKNCLIVVGKIKDCTISYRAVYDLNGKFMFLKLYKHKRLCALVSWKQEYDIEDVETINKDGNRNIVTSKYLSTAKIQHKLVEKSFYTCVNNEVHNKVFRLTDGKWTSEGDFPKSHLAYWISQ